MAEGKVALVTGSAQGIGRAIALELAARGADVVVNDFNNVNMNETVELVKEKGRRCLAFDVDISDRDQVEKMMNDVVEHFGHLDIVVANAYYSIREPLLTADWDNVKKTLEVTQFGTYHTCQLAAQKMVKNTTGSILSEMCWPGNIPYGMAKAAINHMASIMALELATYKINVNVINPGWIDTPGERRYSSDEVIAAGALKIPWGRLGVPEDIAKAAAFLCSGDADYITGTTLRVDGGMVPGQITPPDKSPVLTDSWMDAFKKK